MLFYLSSVEEGGETTFPVADNRTYEERVSVLSQPAVMNRQILFSFCHFEMMISAHDLSAPDNTQTVPDNVKEADTVCPNKRLDTSCLQFCVF